MLAGTTPQPPHPKISKTARATDDGSVAYAYVEDAVAYARARRDAGATVLALEITDTSRSVFDYAPPAGELLLVTGAEATGVPPALLAQCDAAVHLPMYGRNTSMNVSVALGAAVYVLLMKLQ